MSKREAAKQHHRFFRRMWELHGSLWSAWEEEYLTREIRDGVACVLGFYPDEISKKPGRLAVESFSSPSPRVVNGQRRWQRQDSIAVNRAQYALRPKQYLGRLPWQYCGYYQRKPGPPSQPTPQRVQVRLPPMPPEFDPQLALVTHRKWIERRDAEEERAREQQKNRQKAKERNRQEAKERQRKEIEEEARKWDERFEKSRQRAAKRRERRAYRLRCGRLMSRNLKSPDGRTGRAFFKAKKLINHDFQSDFDKRFGTAGGGHNDLDLLLSLCQLVTPIPVRVRRTTNEHLVHVYIEHPRTGALIMAFALADLYHARKTIRGIPNGLGFIVETAMSQITSGDLKKHDVVASEVAYWLARMSRGKIVGQLIEVTVMGPFSGNQVKTKRYRR